MKKTIYLLAGLVFLAAPATKAQVTGSRYLHHKAYVRAGLGYSFTHAGMTDFDGLPVNGTSSISSVTGPTITQYNTKKYSFGAGVNGTAAAGFMFHRNIGIELGFTGILSSKKYSYQHVNETGAAKQVYLLTAHNNGSVALLPALVLQLPGASFDCYSRLGLLIPLAGQIIVDEEVTAQIGTNAVNTTVYQWRYDNYFSLGIAGAVGVTYHINNRIGLWLEANGISRNSFIKMRQMTSYSLNGTDMLHTTTFNDRVTEYEFDYSKTSAAPDPNAADKGLTYSAPQSNIGLVLGVSVGL